jgi:galactarate dehydratase
MSDALIRLHPSDNVAIVRRAVAAGESIAPGLMAATDIPSGHKIALQPIARGAPIVKYGQAIGQAATDIPVGAHVHTHNLAVAEAHAAPPSGSNGGGAAAAPLCRATFMGYPRADGRTGTRNFIVVMVSVNCSATAARAVADHFSRSGELDDYPAIDGVVALTHGTGCGLAVESEGYRLLTRTLAGYATHPNVVGTVMIGLGCEANQIDRLLEAEGLSPSPDLATMTIQDLGGTRRTIEAGIEAVRAMLRANASLKREPCDLSGLTLALECGGSDGFSGISANPALGYATDLLVAHGGTAVLSETPEISGGEHLLARRARDPAVAQRLLERVQWWHDHMAATGARLDDNPSPGNRAGGITTITEKSLGAIAKAGTSPLTAVYGYAERIDEHGLVFMDTPGYDPVAVTGQVAGGCNLVCFTTGRGSTAGYKPAPCVKLATNTPMFRRMADDMDLDCGGIVTGTHSVEEMGRAIFDKLIAVASGEKTASEMQNYGDNEFVPWQLGATM